MAHIIRNIRGNRVREALSVTLRRRPVLRRLLRDLARKIRDAGGTVYLVGGFLRNVVEGREPGDVDLLVTGLSLRRTGEVLRSLPASVPGVRKVVAAGRHFPVHRIAVDSGDGYIDVSNVRTPGIPLPRRLGMEAPEDDREALVDASRRDFTFNALLFRLDPGPGVGGGRLLDPFGGIEDTRRKRIRCVGNASDRFREDPIRIVRAIRLKNERRGFVLGPATAGAIRRLGPTLLSGVSLDRLSVELVRALSADPAATIEDLHRFGLMKPLLPEWGKSTNRVAEKIATRYRFLRRSLGAPLPRTLLLGNLLADLPFEAAVGAARRLRLPDLRSVASLLRCLHILRHPEALRFPRAETEAALLAAGNTRDCIVLYRAVQRAEQRPARNLTRLLGKCSATPSAINGKWLQRSGIPEGPIRREILLRVREETLAGNRGRRVDAILLAEAMKQDPPPKPPSR